MPKVLIAHPNRDMADQLQDSLRRLARQKNLALVVHNERNLEDARTRVMTERQDLIITHLFLPDSADEQPDAMPRGLDLLRIVRNLERDTPAVLITVVAPDLELRQEIVRLGKTIDIDESGDSIARIVDSTFKLLMKESFQESLLITFVEGENHVWSCHIGGETLDRTFTISEQVMQHLRTYSRGVGLIERYPEWMEQLRVIGEQITETFINSNPTLAPRLKQAINSVGIEHTRVCFQVTSSVHGIALEALTIPEGIGSRVAGYGAAAKDELPFWMLKAPVFRRTELINARQLRLPLFKDYRENLNFLIIEALTEGKPIIDGQKFELKPIKNVKKECVDLENWLRSNPQALGKGEVRRISVSTLEPGKTFVEHLKEVLNEKDWHIIHYSGHSCCTRTNDSASGKGYLFLPGEPLLPVPIHEFASSLKGTQLVLLTSCHSSEEDFAFEMARSLVSAVVGFRWDLEDDIASQFVLDWFYPNLFGTKSVELAFHKACASAQNACKEKRIWAAPVLIINKQQRAIA